MTEDLSPKPLPPTESGSSDRTRSGTIWALACVGLSALYIMNPTAGLFELIPDNLPFVGNLDEAAAAALLLSGLRYFGLDLTALLARRKRVDKAEQ
jgi:hypothetical protein